MTGRPGVDQRATGGLEESVRAGGPGRIPPAVGAALAVLVFVFPSVAVTTNGGGSYIYVLLLGGGLVWGRGWRTLESRERLLLTGFLAVFLVMTLGLVNTEDVSTGVKRLERFARIASVAPVYLLVRRVDRPLHRALGAGAVLGSFAMAAQAWYQVERLGEDRAIGAYHHILFGDLALLWGCLAILFLFFRIRGWTGLLAASGAVAAATYAALLAEARGPWLFAPVFLATVSWAYGREWLADRRLRRGTAAVALSAALIVAWQGESLGRRVELAVADLRSYAEDPGAENSWAIRINLWRNTLLLVREDPLLGEGPGDFQHRMRDMVADGRSHNRAVVDYSSAHSIYFDALANAGILGLVAMFAAYLVVPFWIFAGAARSLRAPEGRFSAVAGMTTVLAFATFGLSEALWTRNPFVNTYVVCVVVLLAGLHPTVGRSR